MPKKNITPLSNTEIASFCSQMAMILKSGISSIEGISIMLQDAKGSDETELLAVMNDTLTQTGILHERGYLSAYHDIYDDSRIYRPDYKSHACLQSGIQAARKRNDRSFQGHPSYRSLS